MNKPPIAGSDGHFYSELGNVIMLCESIESPEKATEIKYCSGVKIALSQGLRMMRLAWLGRITKELMSWERGNDG